MIYLLEKWQTHTQASDDLSQVYADTTLCPELSRWVMFYLSKTRGRKGRLQIVDFLVIFWEKKGGEEGRT
jgi:hypothetical protein